MGACPSDEELAGRFSTEIFFVKNKKGFPYNPHAALP